jgi:hypothetical protein
LAHPPGNPANQKLPNQFGVDSDNPTQPVRSSSLSWSLVPGIQVHRRTWDGETSLYIYPIGETMVVSEFGAAAIAGISAGCTDLPSLEHWCQERRVADAGEDMSGVLSSFVASLAELEIIELRQ